MLFDTLQVPPLLLRCPIIRKHLLIIYNWPCAWVIHTNHSTTAKSEFGIVCFFRHLAEHCIRRRSWPGIVLAYMTQLFEIPCFWAPHSVSCGLPAQLLSRKSFCRFGAASTHPQEAQVPNVPRLVREVRRTLVGRFSP
jgi:hypothetical protein